ncbi:MAG: hypothetical protein EXQ94_10790 [Alphaproteobacteria bacterium]|nr:hypothetical protein [Alphaproteobacteria bacterium]
MGDPVTRDDLVFDVAYALGFVATLPRGRRLTEEERRLIAGRIVDHLFQCRLVVERLPPPTLHATFAPGRPVG